MQQKVFDTIVKNIFGKQAGGLASLLFEKKNLNEFLIAKKLELTPNQARNILYRFSHLGFASFIKKKDKRKGWYTYFWSIDIAKILGYIKNELEKEIDGLEKQLKERENKRFFICPICKTEVSEETALSYDFACPECGNVYELSSEDKAGNELRAKVKTITQQLNLVSNELAQFEGEKARKLAKEREKVEKKKSEERKKKLMKRRREKARNSKKKAKKPKKAKKKSKKKASKKGKKR